jgi:sarcosine oxidase gamma subunit
VTRLFLKYERFAFPCLSEISPGRVAVQIPGQMAKAMIPNEWPLITKPIFILRNRSTREPVS